MKIGAREIGPGRPVYVIAEIGVNHDGDAGRALELTRAAAAAGADAVKLQFFETDRLLSAGAKLAAYQRAAGETDAVAMLRRLELPMGAMADVVACAHGLGLHAIVTPFSVEHVDGLTELGWDAFKTASPDIVHEPLLSRLASTGRPMIISTGASTMEEVERAAGWLGGHFGRIAFLQCVSAYPVPPGDESFEGIGAIARVAPVVGYSDHTTRLDAGARAVMAGAAILEKHLTYDRAAAGPDHAASLDPSAFAAYAAGARSATPPGAPPPGEKRLRACERDVRTASRQSVVAARPIAAGERFAQDVLTFKRPGVGLEPFRIASILGRTAVRPIEADAPVSAGDAA